MLSSCQIYGKYNKKKLIAKALGAIEVIDILEQKRCKNRKRKDETANLSILNVRPYHNLTKRNELIFIIVGNYGMQTAFKLLVNLEQGKSDECRTN